MIEKRGNKGNISPRLQESFPSRCPHGEGEGDSESLNHDH